MSTRKQSLGLLALCASLLVHACAVGEMSDATENGRELFPFDQPDASVGPAEPGTVDPQAPADPSGPSMPPPAAGPTSPASPEPPPPECPTARPDVSARNGWRSAQAPIAAFGSLYFEVLARPTAANLNGLLAIGASDIETFTDAAILVRFGQDGTIDARDGGAYASDALVPYEPGTWYTIAVDANIAVGTYDVEIGACGEPSQTLISGARFRSDANVGDWLTHWAAWSSQSAALDVATPTWMASDICVPASCSALGRECGTVGDGCLGLLHCGGCGSNEACSSGVCIGAPLPLPRPTPPPPPAPGGAPNAWNTGITEEWCPDWEARKVDTGGRRVRTDGAVIEYEEITGTLHIDAKDVTVRCVKVHASSTQWAIECSDNGNSSNNCTEGFLAEDVEAYGTGAGLWNAPLGLVVTEASVRRMHMHGGCDGMKFDGGMVRDSFIEDNYRCPSSDPHNDGWQSGGSRGPMWLVNSTIEGPWRYQTSAIILKGDSGPIRDVTVHGNLLSGGNWTFYLRNPNTPDQVRITDNTFINRSWNPDISGSEGSAFDTDTDGPGQCVEYAGNELDDGAPIPPGASGAPSNVLSVGSCPGITPIPTWQLSGASLSRSSCSRGQGTCAGIDLAAEAGGSQTGGSPRWRVHCGRAGDLWENVTSCDGRSSCTATDVCDYSTSPSGAYTARIYSESGPGSGVRVSDSASQAISVGD